MAIDLDELRGLADCDARAGEPLGKALRAAADDIAAKDARIAELEAALRLIGERGAGCSNRTARQMARLARTVVGDAP